MLVCRVVTAVVLIEMDAVGRSSVRPADHGVLDVHGHLLPGRCLRMHQVSFGFLIGSAQEACVTFHSTSVWSRLHVVSPRHGSLIWE